MQAILQRYLVKFFCIHPVYNCGGFCGETEKCSKISPKCDIADEENSSLKAQLYTVKW